ncbi:SusC/RagA family TonB-linked outer membrane protein [Plebeiibacterium sediminum]|uniref:SusC/RagA family TonB-linked outer membrane protein n=1 Tax=Plebeiibacterium sediminum TaxID=2992112 RepID=A0AAE3M3L2_9BACT|nr:SusC/RagA family TonB-linked outer membrane protein [Plebeiobacterium sediminum]MCW3786562.1 SusC/RagA family TonB-linked outer membrane protein [Plebeiobacterium sediminum]
MKIFVSILLTALFLTSNLMAQEGRVIKGRIFDSSNSTPLPGANIVILPTYKGTISDADGNFTLEIKNTKAQNMELMATFIGFNTVKVPITSANYYEITLESTINELEQVIVTSSYGTKKLKEEVVGSISTIQAKDIQVEQAFESVDKMLDGQIAGVSIEVGASPLDPVQIDIRGQGTLTPTSNAVLTSSAQPLIIIDGVIMSEESGIDNELFDGSGTFSENFQNPIAQIAPEDIESINVLKDAAAVSIYGADGANGVILITTKKGKKGKMSFHASTQHGISQAVNRIKYLNGEQYTEVRNAYLSNTGQETIPDNGVDTDWYDLLNRNGSFHKYAFDASGGSDHLIYRVGMSYLKNNEPQDGNYSNQYRLSTSLNYKTGKFNAGLQLNPSITEKINPNTYYSYAFAPNIPVYNEDGSYADMGVTGLANPLAAIDQNRNKTNTKGIIGSINLGYDITSNWNVKTQLGVDYKDKEQDRYFSGENESGQANGTFSYEGVTYPNWGRRVINYRKSLGWNWQLTTFFQKYLNENHYLSLTAGIELREETKDMERYMATGFVNPNVVNSVFNAVRGTDDPKTAENEIYNTYLYGSDTDDNSRVSLFGQFNYAFQKKYFFLANFRRDQSSVFGDDTDVAYNGGIGVSWILSKENFLSNARWIDLLKIKASMGSTGNSRIGSYRSKGLYTFESDYTGYNQLPYANAETAPNSNLGWEVNIKYNAGIDFNFLSRYTLTVDYFYDNIKDMISSRDIPSETGYSSVQINGTDMVNQGIELNITTRIIDTDSFKWRMNFNIATLNNKITSVRNFGDDFSTASQATAIKEGYSTSDIWGVRWVGIDPATGRDLVQKDGQIMDARTYYENYETSDAEPIGNTQADFYGGFGTTFTYKNKLNLSITGAYKYGADKMVSRDLISNYRITTNRNLSVNAYDFWRGAGDMATQQAPTNNEQILSNSSKYLYDTSNLKIKSITLSYNIPVDKLKIGLKSLAFNVNVTNPAIFYKVKSPKGKNGIKEFMYTYPQARTWTAGLNASF